MRYLLMICTTDPIDLTPEQGDEVGAATDAWVEDTDARGVRIMGNELEPAASARTVKVRDGERVVTTGPFAEASEQMAGFDLIECADMDEAVEVAAAHPMARLGAVEVRPLLEY